MNKTKYILATHLFLLSTTLFAATADQDTQGLITPYGDNPNIFHVFAYKTQTGIVNGVTRMGAATQRGIDKLKPAAKTAQQDLKTAAQNTEQKITDAKDIILATPSQGAAPISQQPLSQDTHIAASSTLSSAPNQPSTKTYALTD
ncbi:MULTISPECIES: hypothetical protein [unclassified Acinetobacter]|uniref:hypothetical protein n=1 Tax=unclassified Acinetobacter TaxID=196816 RepID=UPI00293480C6|nr:MULTISPECIES: hypothetical protein [unclassified Acinetobacter]WOE30572.1 hypothetical protein QSG84_09225 [Acinetobacter sp. SAAs470]WOE38764.1 hypothetical protein QSG86_02890 [Acinetobacter sp. SAAs474]